MKIIFIVGARPNFMKAAPILSQLKKYPDKFTCLLIHTGQHYDAEMSNVFFEELRLPKPDVYLGIGSGSHAEQTARVMIELEKIFLHECPDLVMVVGDVNSTLAGALTAAKLCIRVAHIEAGLRSFDRTMPEEINRMVTDSIADYLFTTCEEANANLIREGHSQDKIFFVGNVMIDTLLQSKQLADASPALKNFDLKTGAGVKPYALVTLHRPSNVDTKNTLKSIFEALHSIAQKMIVIFPVHPRTARNIIQFGLSEHCSFLTPEKARDKEYLVQGAINCTQPLGYLEFLSLAGHAKLVITDSGGIQEETTIMKIPCLTLRDNTERAITIHEGTNMLAGNDTQKIIDGARAQLSKNFDGLKSPKFWDGMAAERIVMALNTLFR